MFYNKEIFNRCFGFSKKYWYKNIKNIPLYFRLIHELVRYGYDERALWDTFSWFTTTMKSILERYREGHQGYPVIIEGYSSEDPENEEKNLEVWEGIIDRMVELLELMDEECPKYDSEEYENIDGLRKKNTEMNEAKNEFFNLFSTHFWDLWD